MAADVELSNVALEASRLKLREANCIVTIVGNTVDANIIAYTDNTAIQVYVATNVQPTPTDSGANFGTLVSNANPSIIGILVTTGNAGTFFDVAVPTSGIVSGAMTAGVVSRKGTSTTGITASGNIACVISCTGLVIDGANATTSFPLLVRWYCTPANAS